MVSVITKKLTVQALEYVGSANASTYRHVTSKDFYQSVQLEDWHNDPFDRIIIAQAKSRGLPIITFDVLFERYDVVTIF